MTTLACFGDSLAEGYPYGNAASWLAEVERQTNLQVLNYGVCGETTMDIMQRLMRWHPAPHVRHVLYQGGMNDILQGVPLAATLKTMHYADYWCQQHKQKLCLVMPWLSGAAELNPAIQELRQAMREEFAALNLFLLDLQPALSVPVDPNLFLDGVHPMGMTYKQLGRYGASLLQNWADHC